jgi:hypothetical protein
MTPPIHRLIRCYILLPPLFAICSAAYAEPQLITVNDPRPVARAVAKLEAIYGRHITYEDPPYVHKSEIADVTDQVARDRGVNKVLIPRGGAFSFTFDVDEPADPRRMKALASTALTPRDAILEMLASYDAALGGGEMFDLIESNGLFHVVPYRYTGLSGRRERITPLLDLAVSVSPKQRTAADVVTEICDLLSSATDQTVVLGTTPWSQLARHATTISASREAARSVLSRLLAELPVPLSWRLLYDPGLQWYVLNIHVVGAAANY